jgi:hypothetical protein
MRFQKAPTNLSQSLHVVLTTMVTKHTEKRKSVSSKFNNTVLVRALSRLL